MPIRRLSILLALPLILSCSGSKAETAGDTETATASTTASTTATTTELPTTGELDPCTASPQALADCTDQALYTADLTFIADIRMPGSPHWQAVQDLCADRLAELGYDVQLQDYGTGINVVGMRPGTTSPDELVVIGAHYDHIPECLGADDNASGVAATLEIARLLAKVPFERSIVIGCWDEEEDGLIGSEAFVAASATSDIVVNFNFDMIGVRRTEENTQTVPPGFEIVFPDQSAEIQATGNRGDFIAIITSASANEHALALAAAAARITLRNAVLAIPGGSETSDLFADLRRSDHAAFWDAGKPAVFLTDTGEFRHDNYHCIGGPDVVADLDLTFAADVTRISVEASAIALKM